ncbi:Tar ligand binding domain-containing protein [Salmonella enterica subsp. enterica serovar Newport]|uniref:Methyl-accepting chemotaxis protein n=1 Tax=Salmonella enterica subsp. enterica serovar Rissen TaxID=399587 RepID=A0A724QIT0_SALET|nr:methyl-accepting chemotaxis protein [Salmonella enterica subsp. enterica serovar Newport]EAQ2497572.1 methyl-accepting chemotaxis protein [Salmonella enterica]EBK1734021.1 methyl-accepting chemotaxis protein [Salmonella enterica subsp. enterica serovar Heidelberg]ECB6042828.1 methyl-accepting chemotaxis protein [Salmonella enterica subsp. enterica serovar Stanley]ECD6580614.1 methyl-accepting chemotaxis protein [Salmonella enterica subsp. enterica serovar Braenderup]EEB7894629.1 methyl-acce
MNLIRDIKIRTMMIIILIIFSVLWGGVSAFVLHSLQELTTDLSLTDIQQENRDIMNGDNGLYYRVENTLDRTLDAIRKNDSAAISEQLESAAADIGKLRADLEKFRTGDHGSIDKATTDVIYNSSYQLLTRAIVPMYDALKAGRGDEYVQLSNQPRRELRRNFTAAIEQYNTEIDKLIRDDKQHITWWVDTCRNVLIAALVIGLLIVFLTDRYLVRYLVKPLECIQAHLQILADGKLQTRIMDMGKNCAGKLVPFIQDMQDNWVRTVSDIRSSSHEIYRSAGEIAAGNTDLSSRTEEQASALEQTAASMEELSAVVKQNADNASQASQLAQTASQAANKGGEIVGHVVSTMNNISASSQKIVDIIAVINSIAFQTNILALNAAVEAARAGEQGRGFAVVASEVRNLAQRSAQSAKEIEGLIAASADSVKTGSEQVALAGEAMAKIVRDVTNVTDIMGEIASASAEQSKGITQVGQAVVEMDSVTQQNAALVEQSSAASASLEEQARRLTEIVSIFQLATANEPPSVQPLQAPVQQKKDTPVAVNTHASVTSDNWETF